MATSEDLTRTILFTDVEGSTELLSHQGDERASEILRIHEEIVRRGLALSRGREVSFRGDGFLATFPVLADALACAVDVQRALAGHNRGDPSRRVRVRIGIHCGEVTEVAGNLYGQAVHAAARVMAEAAGAEIFVSAVVARAGAGSGLRFRDRGLFWLKGFPEQWRLFELEWRDGVDEEEGVEARGRRTPFVARDAERADLRRSVRAALGGEGRLLVVAGEAGVGKTRLVEEVGAEAEARGMRVLTGHSVAMQGGTPYLPFVEILEGALLGPRSTEESLAALGDDASEISRLVPGLKRVIPDLASPVELPPEQARRYLWASVEGFLRRAAQERPLLLVLEDLHWSDGATLELLQHLAPALADVPILIVGTYRDTEVDGAHPLAGALAELNRKRLVHRIPLRRLSPEDVALVIAGLAGQTPPAGLAMAIHGATEGNSFFVEELFLHLVESGALFDENGRFRDGLRLAEMEVPDSVRLVVGGRLARLAQPTRDALAVAAVSGRVFEPAVVGDAADLDADALAAAMDEAERARLVAPTRSDSGRLEFVHELIRQALLAEIPSLRRQRLHARTTAAIEAVHAARVEEWAEELAYHLARSGPGVDPGRLVRYLRLAGDRAVRAAAFADGLSHFEQALAALPSGDEPERAELLERLALAQRGMGRWEEASATMDRALDEYRRLGRSEAFGRLCSVMAYHLAWAARFQEAVALAQRGLAELGDVPNPDRARLLSVTGWVVGLTGDYAAATGLFEGARQLSDALGDRRALADVLHMQTAHQLSYGEFEQGVENGLRAAQVFEAQGALWELCSVLAFVTYESGTGLHLERAAEVGARVLALADRLGHLGARFLVLAEAVRREGLMAGDLTRTELLGREMIDVCTRANLPWLYTGHLYLGFVAHARGRWEEAERELRRAVELEPSSAFAGQSTMHLAVLLADLGRSDEVLAIGYKLRPGLPVPGRVATLGTWAALLGMGEALFVSGRHAEAATLHPLLNEVLSLGEWWAFDCGLAHTRAGAIAAAAGHWEEAERHFDHALLTARRLGHRMEEAHVQRLRALMLAARGGAGDAARAAALGQDAADRYRALGMDALAELVLAERNGTDRRRATAESRSKAGPVTGQDGRVESAGTL